MKKRNSCIIIFIFFTLIASLLYRLVVHSSSIIVWNKTKDEICLNYAKIGLFKYLKNSQIGKNKSLSFTYLFGFSYKTFISYHPGQCEGNRNVINSSCVLDRKPFDGCLIYIQSDGSLDCLECY